MVKYLFIFINSITLFLMSFFGGDSGITVTSNIPKTMAPGSEVAIEIKVAKGNQSGFAKLQLDVPAGITVKEIENAGSNYSFGDGVAKWVWASLPSEAEIVVKCYLVAEKDANGTKTIGGKYSYVENNAKQVVEMAAVDVSVGGEGSTAGNNASGSNTTATNSNTETAANTNTGATNTNTETQQTFTTANSNSEPAGNITVQRTVTKGSAEGEYNIDLKINKGLTKGFARYSDDLPDDMSARSGKTEGASFSVADGKIKFVWVNAPEQEIVEISYVVTGVKRPLTLKGEYSYLEQNLSKTYNLPAETITPEQNTAANTNTETSNTNTSTATNTEVANTNTTSANTNTESSTQTNTETAQTNTTSSGNNGNEPVNRREGNVKFMVQVGAFTNNNVTAARLKRKFNISEKIISEMQGGFSKFMVGSHDEYKGARDHRERVKSGNGVASAFVVAYNTGKRITVQEALMITNQRWFR